MAAWARRWLMGRPRDFVQAPTGGGRSWWGVRATSVSLVVLTAGRGVDGGAAGGDVPPAPLAVARRLFAEGAGWLGRCGRARS